MSPSSYGACIPPVEGTPESDCLLRCGRLLRSSRFQLRKRPGVQLARSLDRLYTGSTPQRASQISGLLRGASARSRARPRSPTRLPLWSTRLGPTTSHTAHPSVGLAPTDTTPECPEIACSNVAPTSPDSVPTARFSDLYFCNFHRNQPIHRIACCDVATPSGSARFTFKTAPELYFYNCCKSLYTGNTSHPVSQPPSMVPRDCLLRCGSDESGVFYSPSCISTTPAGTCPFTKSP